MAEYSIISKDGSTVKATGAPVYYGTYLKPGYLEFGEIGSPTPISLEAGDYVDYNRTGLRYKLYNTPKVTKQGERNLYGGAFVYENVQFFDATKELEIAPFVDLVPFDNLIHFSTRNTVSFYGTPANVAERIQACLAYWFPSSLWEVVIVSGLDTDADAELIETLTTEMEFSVSGVSCLGALDQIYEKWNGLGWSYSNSGGRNRIVIGAPNKRTSANTTTSYGRIGDNGLVTIARSVSNADSMGTRLYAYGSMRNMPTDYYRSKGIKDAESVDIAHLMLPINPVSSLGYDGWGVTDGYPDARLAYIEDSDAVTKYGLIPKYAYFDGSDSEYPEIFPSISGVTIGDVIDGKEQISDTSYIPSLTVWNRDDRVDEIVSAINPTDNGGASADGNKYTESGTFETVPALISTAASGSPVETVIGNFAPTAPSDTLYMTLDLSGTVSISGSADSSWFEMRVRVEGVSPTSNVSDEALIPLIDIGEDDRFAFSLEGVSFNLSLTGMTGVRIYFHVERTGWGLLDCEVSVNAGSVFLGWSSSLGRTFKATIPQIGFNILQYADMGGGKTISMLTGMCAGRDFPIKAASYDSSNDTWVLTLGRIKDFDTGLWYPNSDFQIAQGDQYILLDIAMPELYIAMASIRLLKAAQRLLEAISEESPFYEPNIDSKKVVGEGRVLKAGMWMHLIGDEIVDGGEDYSLIDTLRIDENASNIPVYEVTLRKRKPIEWTETTSGTIEKPTSSSVEESTQQTVSRPPDWFIAESYEEGGETKNRLKLNPKYQGMYAEGWVSAGGLSDEGGGGSGDNTQFVFSQSSTDPGDPSDGDSTSWTASVDVSWITLAKSSGSGSETLSYTVAENTTTASRTGRITITYFGGTETLTVTQAGVAAADGSISPTTVSQVSTSGTTLTFTVTDADSVGWTLTSNASWLTLSKTSGTGGSTVTATVAANTSSSARNASLTFTSGGTTTTIAVSQKAAEASASISYPDEITSAAQAVRMTITDTANHGWLLAWFDASSSMITDGAVVSGNASKSGKSISGTGNAVVTLTVSAYDGRWVGDNNEIYLVDNETSDMTVVRFYQG